MSSVAKGVLAARISYEQYVAFHTAWAQDSGDPLELVSEALLKEHLAEFFDEELVLWELWYRLGYEAARRLPSSSVFLFQYSRQYSVLPQAEYSQKRKYAQKKQKAMK